MLEWEQCLDAIFDKLEEQQFNTWIKPLGFSISDDLSEIVLFSGNRVKSEYVKLRFGGLIKEAIREFFPKVKSVEFGILRRENYQKPEAPATNADVKTDIQKIEVLPIADAVRRLPNLLARSGLFGISKKRKQVKNLKIASVEGYDITQENGELLNQSDLDLVLCMMQIVQQDEHGVMFAEFDANFLLKMLGRTTNSGRQHEQLKADIQRLNTANIAITIKNGRRGIASSIITHRDWDEKEHHRIEFSKHHVHWLFNNDYSLVSWEQRLALGSNLLAKWLLNQYVTHAKPMPYKVETLRQLSRSETGELREFRRMLREALKLLEEVGCITSWEIDADDLVHVTRNASASQMKHLRVAKAKAKKKEGI